MRRTPTLSGVYLNGDTVTASEDQARLERLQEVREGMEALHTVALAERGGRTFTTEETLEFLRRVDLAAETVASRALERLESDPALLEGVQSRTDGDVTIEE